MYELRLYIRELLTFLSTVTIKDNFMANHMRNVWLTDKYLHTSLTELHPYYRQLRGELILTDVTPLEEAYGIYRTQLSHAAYERKRQPILQLLERFKLKLTTTVNGQEISNRLIYRHSNPLMVVKSYDTQEYVPVCRELFLAPDQYRTAEIYKIPNQGYRDLAQQYPENAAVLRAMSSPPTQTAQELAALPDLSLISADFEQLEEAERSSMYEALVKTLKLCQQRWHVSEYRYEDMYAVSWQGILWGLLFQALLTQRIDNIRTHQVHSFHLWEYLRSHGLGDYREALTSEQQRFLYRNLTYLLRHKGTAEAMDLLDYGLLYDGKLSLHNYLLQQQLTEDPELGTASLVEDGRAPVTTDRVRSGAQLYRELALAAKPPYYQTVTKLAQHAGDHEVDHYTEASIGQPKELTDVFQREQSAGLEYQDQGRYQESITRQHQQFSATPHTRLRTKLLDFTAQHTMTRQLQLQLLFLMESTYYRCSLNHCQFGVTIQFPGCVSQVSLSSQHALALILYGLERLYRPASDPQTTIDQVYVRLPYVPSFAQLPRLFQSANQPYSLAGRLTSTGYHSWPNQQADATVFRSAKEFSQTLQTQWEHFWEIYRELTMFESGKLRDAWQTIRQVANYEGWVSLSLLSPYHNYQELIDDDDSLRIFMDSVAGTSNQTKLWISFITALLRALFPGQKFIDYLSGLTLSLRQQLLKQLFQSLVSYNLAFIENNEIAREIHVGVWHALDTRRKQYRRRRQLTIDSFALNFSHQLWHRSQSDIWSMQLQQHSVQPCRTPLWPANIISQQQGQVTP